MLPSRSAGLRRRRRLVTHPESVDPDQPARLERETAAGPLKASRLTDRASPPAGDPTHDLSGPAGESRRQAWLLLLHGAFGVAVILALVLDVDGGSAFSPPTTGVPSPPPPGAGSQGTNPWMVLIAAAAAVIATAGFVIAALTYIRVARPKEKREKQSYETDDQSVQYRIDTERETYLGYVKGGLGKLVGELHDIMEHRAEVDLDERHVLGIGGEYFPDGPSHRKYVILLKHLAQHRDEVAEFSEGVRSRLRPFSRTPSRLDDNRVPAALAKVDSLVKRLHQPDKVFPGEALGLASKAYEAVAAALEVKSPPNEATDADR